MQLANPLLLQKVKRVLYRKADAFVGRFYSLDKTLDAMALRPYELHLELTNLCNADCVFCPYQFQERKTEFMPDEVFEKAVADFVRIGGGSVGLTPIVGDALIDPNFVRRVKHLRSHPEIDKIWVTTNAILLDKHGIQEVLDSGITHFNISTAGFEEAMYVRVYRNRSYRRMKDNVVGLLERNSARPDPLPITIALRPDRPLDEVMKHPDFQPVLQHNPTLDFTWSFTSANGRITREILPAGMRLRQVSVRNESCVNLWNGPIVLPDGTVMACSCVAAMDATTDLGIGNILSTDLLQLWTGMRLQEIRRGFGTPALNKTCAGCDMYRDLELYRTSEGRQRAAANTARMEGTVVQRRAAAGPFSGG
jgi:hypothetical protein